MENVSQLSRSIFDYLLFHHKVTHYFSSQDLQKEIDLFNIYMGKVTNMGIDLPSVIKSFAKERNWRGDKEEDFRISSAIYNGWLYKAFGTLALKELITKRGPDKNPTYKYQCTRCKKPFSQNQYNLIKKKEDQITDCPSCHQGKLVKTRAIKESWTMWNYLRRPERVQELISEEPPLTPEQLKKYGKAIDEWGKYIGREWKRLTFHRFPTGEEIEGLREQAKSYLVDIYKALPGKNRLCTLKECLNLIPPRSRNNKQYCSERCRLIAKARRVRRK